MAHVVSLNLPQLPPVLLLEISRSLPICFGFDPVGVLSSLTVEFRTVVLSSVCLSFDDRHCTHQLESGRFGMTPVVWYGSSGLFEPMCAFAIAQLCCAALCYVVLVY
ncbi:unnamed protein product [Umbelopsis ramanniana]